MLFDYYMALPPKNRLKKNVDFLFVLRGKTKTTKALFGRIIAVKGRFPITRFGFVAPKKAFSRSSARNLLKRRASEWVRRNFFLFRCGTDIVFVFEKGALLIPRRALYEEFERACRNTGLFKQR